MTVETIRSLCRTLSAVTEDVKWGHDLCFSVENRGGKETGEDEAAAKRR